MTFLSCTLGYELMVYAETWSRAKTGKRMEDESFEGRLNGVIMRDSTIVFYSFHGLRGLLPCMDAEMHMESLGAAITRPVCTTGAPSE